MSSYDYASLKTKAEELITKYGTSIVIQRVGEAGDWQQRYDEETGRPYWENDSTGTIVYEIPTGVTESVTGNAVITEWPLFLIEQGYVEAEDLRAVIAINTEIKDGDTLVLPSSREYRVVPPIKRVSPDGATTLVQECAVRG